MAVDWESFKPRRITEFKTGESHTIMVSEYSQADMTFTSPETGEEVTVPGLRLKVSWKDGGPVDEELNVVSKDLIWKLRPILTRPDFSRWRITITAVGVAPKRIYTVEAVPPT